MASEGLNPLQKNRPNLCCSEKAVGVFLRCNLAKNPAQQKVARGLS